MINKKRVENYMELGAGLGLVFGIIGGAVIDNIGLGIALGMTISAGVGSIVKKPASKEEKINT